MGAYLLGVLVGWAKFFSWFGGTRGRRFHQKAGKKMIGSLDDQRRAQRLPIYLPVQVYGKLDGEPFSENTQTINVSAWGGLVPISASIVRAQKLILTNLQTDQDLTCRVARLIPAMEARSWQAWNFCIPLRASGAPPPRAAPQPRPSLRNTIVGAAIRCPIYLGDLFSKIGNFRM